VTLQCEAARAHQLEAVAREKAKDDVVYDAKRLAHRADEQRKVRHCGPRSVRTLSAHGTRGIAASVWAQEVERQLHAVEAARERDREAVQRSLSEIAQCKADQAGRPDKTAHVCAGTGPRLRRPHLRRDCRLRCAVSSPSGSTT
jgi:hypothetical protein